MKGDLKTNGHPDNMPNRLKRDKAEALGKASALDRMAALRPASPKIPADAFTLKEYMKRFGEGEHRSKQELEDLIASGKLATAIGRASGHLERMYWPA
jgi:hypothetical protein